MGHICESEDDVDYVIDFGNWYIYDHETDAVYATCDKYFPVGSTVEISDTSYYVNDVEECGDAWRYTLFYKVNRVTIVNGHNNGRDGYLYICPEGASWCIFVHEGTGENLFDSDIENGYVDYLLFETGKIVGREFEEEHGGTIMYPELIQDKPHGLLDCVCDVLEFLGIKGMKVYIV